MSTTWFLVLAGVVVVGFVFWFLAGRKKEGAPTPPEEPEEPTTPSAPPEI